jgi:hypothetical protein
MDETGRTLARGRSACQHRAGAMTKIGKPEVIVGGALAWRFCTTERKTYC